MATLAITGGSGKMATLLRPRLRAAGHQLVLVDVVEPNLPPTNGETFLKGSVTDLEFLSSAFKGAEGVVHLGGFRTEKPWPQILETNINGGHATLEAARLNSIRKILLASSTHAVGFSPAAQALAVGTLPPRPDTLYGVGKATLEALGSLYADKFSMKVVSARIGTASDLPRNERSLSTWLSPDDAALLVQAAMNHLGMPGHHVVWGVSNNSEGWFNLGAGRRIGYFPQDNASAWCRGTHLSDGSGGRHPLGGPMAEAGYNVGVDNHPAEGLPHR